MKLFNLGAYKAPSELVHEPERFWLSTDADQTTKQTMVMIDELLEQSTDITFDPALKEEVQSLNTEFKNYLKRRDWLNLTSYHLPDIYNELSDLHWRAVGLDRKIKAKKKTSIYDYIEENL